MEINGVAHTFITAGNFAAARAFYGQLLPFLGLTVVADTRTLFTASAAEPALGSMHRLRNMPVSASSRAALVCIIIAGAFARERTWMKPMTF